MFVGQLVCLWNRFKTLVGVTSLLACCSLTRCCTLRLMSARTSLLACCSLTRCCTLRLMSVRLRSAITPCRRCSRFPARLRPFFRCRGSKSIFFGFTHLYTHTHSTYNQNLSQPTGSKPCTDKCWNVWETEEWISNLCVNLTQTRYGSIFALSQTSNREQLPKWIPPPCHTVSRVPSQHLITQFFTGRMLFLTPNQQCQSTEGNRFVGFPAAASSLEDVALINKLLLLIDSLWHGVNLNQQSTLTRVQQ